MFTVDRASKIILMRLSFDWSHEAMKGGGVVGSISGVGIAGSGSFMRSMCFRDGAL